MDFMDSIKVILRDAEIISDYLIGKYLYPCEVDRLRSKIIGEGDAVSVDEYLLDNDPNFLVKQRKFKKLIENGHFNPHKPYRLNEYFVETKGYKELNKIFLFKENPSLIHNLVHIGDRGSGKTALQNCWLYRNNERLEEERIFWVRCDGHKLYKLWLDHEGILDQSFNQKIDIELMSADADIEPSEIKIGELINLETYFDIQLVYVFSKYILNSNRNLFQDIVSIMKKERPKFDMPVSKSIHHKENKDLYQRLLDLNTTILKEEKGRAEGYSYAYDQLMRIAQETRQIEKNKWIYTSKALQKFLYKHGFWLLRIIDGVDNVHINQIRAKKFYQYMLNEVSNFTLANPPKNTINYLAIRERTYIELAEINPLIKATASHVKKIKHVTPSIKEVLSERYNYSMNNCFIEGEGIYEKISKAVIEVTPKENNSYNHNNIRSFLHNKISLISLVYYRVMQLGGSHANIPLQVENISQSNRFLNGRLFLNTKEQWVDLNLERGLCCINIFYFDNEKFPCSDIKFWYGMCKVRILQLLSFETIEKDKLITFLNVSFNYPIDLIELNLYDLRAFGLVDSVFNNGICYKTSIKGENELSSSFMNLDTLYYFSLDSSLPSKLIDSDLIGTHNNKFNTRTRYPYSSLISAITFLLFLKKVNDIEKIKYEEYSESSGFDSSIKFNKIRLPFQSDEAFITLSNSIEARYNTACDDSEGENFQQYLSMLKLILK